MTILIAAMIIWPNIAEYCVTAIIYVTTAYITLRLGYFGKGGVENFMKIKKDMKEQGASVITKKIEEETLG